MLKRGEENYLRHLKKNDIGFEDVRSCINYIPTGNDLMYFKSETDGNLEWYSGEGSYSEELKQLIISLANAKTYIYDYYYKLCLEAKSLEELRNALIKLNKSYNFDYDVVKLICMVGFDKIETPITKNIIL
jgi:hypothetical protein